MLALDAWREQRCSGCGGDLAETTDPDHDGMLGNPGWHPEEPLRCYRCTALAVSEHAYRKNDHPHALIHRVKFVESSRPRSE